MKIQHCFGAAAILMVALLAGCAEPQATVSGRVTYKGKPLPGGTVSFVTEDGTKQGGGKIESDGTYSAVGVPVGSVRVGVVSAPKGLNKIMPKKAKRPDIPADSPLNEVYGKGSGDYVELPKRFFDPNASGITTTLQAGPNTFNIDLDKFK